MNVKLVAAQLGDLVTLARVKRWAGLILAAEMAAALFLILGEHNILTHPSRPTTTDFVSFYAAGSVANAPGPFQVYDRAVHWAAEQAATEHGIAYVFFFYPPVFLLLCSLLARLPYLVAFLLFEGVTVGGLILILRAIIGPQRWPSWVILPLSYAPLLWSAGFGQNSALTCCVFGIGSLLLARRMRFASGAVFSALLYKPHFGLLLVPALLAGGEWRALAGLAAGGTSLFAATLVIFGVHPWLTYFNVVATASNEFASQHVCPFDLIVSVFGAARLLGLSTKIAGLLGWAAALTVIALVTLAWRHARSSPTETVLAGRLAVLASGTPLVMPIVLFYDQTILLLAAAWLWRASGSAGASKLERTGLALIWLAGLLSYPLPRAVHIPIGTLAGLAMFGLCIRSVFCGRILPSVKPTAPYFRKRTRLNVVRFTARPRTDLIR